MVPLANGVCSFETMDRFPGVIQSLNNVEEALGVQLPTGAKLGTRAVAVRDEEALARATAETLAPAVPAWL